ncbi:MAG: hypothetical protein C4522_03555 [Desulfobacteraceae bacterium]|nr:MAG: hypothetical protein C4522_03555 [Desulfobacteraceae bacterium]
MVPVSLTEIALLIIRKDGFVNASRIAGSMIASAGKAWRYQDDQLMEVPWEDYEKSCNSDNRKDWPPYTIGFTISHLPDNQTVRVDVTTDYDMGVSGNSRGGNESTWILQYQDNGWKIRDIEYQMSWD